MQTTLEQRDAGDGSGDRGQYLTTINGISVHVDNRLQDYRTGRKLNSDVAITVDSSYHELNKKYLTESYKLFKNPRPPRGLMTPRNGKMQIRNMLRR